MLLSIPSKVLCKVFINEKIDNKLGEEQGWQHFKKAKLKNGHEEWTIEPCNTK